MQVILTIILEMHKILLNVRSFIIFLGATRFKKHLQLYAFKIHKMHVTHQDYINIPQQISANTMHHNKNLLLNQHRDVCSPGNDIIICVTYFPDGNGRNPCKTWGNLLQHNQQCGGYKRPKTCLGLDPFSFQCTVLIDSQTQLHIVQKLSIIPFVHLWLDKVEFTCTLLTHTLCLLCAGDTLIIFYYGQN
jgi:hypothetical protein